MTAACCCFRQFGYHSAQLGEPNDAVAAVTGIEQVVRSQVTMFELAGIVGKHLS